MEKAGFKVSRFELQELADDGEGEGPQHSSPFQERSKAFQPERPSAVAFAFHLATLNH
jgi:hypothetical protein